MSPLRALLVDGEPDDRRALRELLAGPLPGGPLPFSAVDVVGEAGDGDAALDRAAALAPDLVFVDTEVPGRPALDVLAALDASPHPTPTVVVTTASEDAALEAYDRGAADVLRKPVRADRLGRSLRRAVPTLLHRARLAPGAGHTERLDAARAALTAAPLDRLWVRQPSGLAVLRTDEVLRIEAQGDYALVRMRSGASHLAYLTLAELEERLSPRAFLRVHRSHIVHLDRVVALEAVDGGRYAVVLDDGSEVVASRSRSRMLRDVAC